MNRDTYMSKKYRRLDMAGPHKKIENEKIVLVGLNAKLRGVIFFGCDFSHRYFIKEALVVHSPQDRMIFRVLMG